MNCNIPLRPDCLNPSASTVSSKFHRFVVCRFVVLSFCDRDRRTIEFQDFEFETRPAMVATIAMATRSEGFYDIYFERTPVKLPLYPASLAIPNNNPNPICTLYVMYTRVLYCTVLYGLRNIKSSD